MRWQDKSLIPAYGEDTRLMKEKTAWARESLCLKWWEMVGVRVNEYPSHLATWEGWKSCPSSSMGAVEREVIWLGVCQWMSSVFGTEKNTPMLRPPVSNVEKGFCNWCMFPLGSARPRLLSQPETKQGRLSHDYRY